MAGCHIGDVPSTGISPTEYVPITVRRAFPPFRAGLRRHLVLLVLVALLPMLVWAGGLTVWSSIQERNAVERGLAETVRALATAVDQETSLTVEALESLALAQDFEANGYAAFQRVAERLVRDHPEWMNVVLTDLSGTQLVNTRFPLGSALPPMHDPVYQPVQATHAEVLRTGRPAISDLFISPATDRHMVSVSVPVRDETGAITHVLSARLRPEALAEILRRQILPHGWVAAVLDRNMRFIARSSGHEHYLGVGAKEWFVEAVAQSPSGIVTGSSMDGEELIFAYTRLDRSGWTVVFGAPRGAAIETLQRSFVLTAGFGGMLLALSLALALWVARRILRPVEALSRVTEPYAPETATGANDTYAVTELDRLHRALDGLSQRLRQSEARFESLFVTAPVMLDVLGPDGRILEVNQHWLSVLGYPRDEVIGRRLWNFLTEDSRAYAENVVFPETLRGGMLDELPLRFRTRSGDVREIMMSSRAERDGDGDVVRVISALRDVTEQRRIEGALARAIEEAEKANDTKTRFLAAASHDLRQPLQALTLYLSVLEGRIGERERPVMKAVGQCVDSLSGLLNDMLDVARLDAGAIEPRPAEVPIADIIDRVATSWRIQAEAKGLRLGARTCEHYMVRTDPALLERALSNLVANAVRYTEHGRVLVGCRRDGPDRVRIEVWDTGIGIPPDKLGDIFEEFHQLGNPERRRDKGTGLGLAIVDRILRLLGHQITVRSEVGRGSVFTITLPTAQSCALPRPSRAAHEAGIQGRRILVVEDEVHVRSALELVLSELGHDVEVADSPEQALERLNFCPELVIADYRLSGHATGVDVIRTLRERCGKSLPAVVLTGDTDPAVIRRIVGEGMHLLHKPLQIEALKGFLQQVGQDRAA